jgi:hypothetical protein
MQDLEQSIRERAYHLWIADGCRDGWADTHWLAAQREVLARSLGGIARVTIAETPAVSTPSDQNRGRLKLFQRQNENDARLKGKVQSAAAEGMLD